MIDILTNESRDFTMRMSVSPDMKNEWLSGMLDMQELIVILLPIVKRLILPTGINLLSDISVGVLAPIQNYLVWNGPDDTAPPEVDI